ncbi:lipopolysaccharide transport periplasmic protein LptA [Marinivivus vitaminiproducens]|uniref:lipopolysaccharide transport periplasmic protein LptA n=1 Tax=Marinivivus vitaminiproducens TaxID=3035935 RepID=UPI00279C68DB|nr:lipopolysaccharide transport periplasmic protein LptA [Geminicoccaceae bacterium SCSIO 64248]
MRIGTVGLILLALAVPGQALAQALSGHDSNQPIEITSDRLEVLQNDRVARFSGQVNVVQGDLVLRSDDLKVFYAQGTGGGDPRIERIEAVGNVVLSSPEETAQGRTGTYELASDMVVLDGDVVLTRGENVIRGDRLEYDLKAGRAEVIATKPAEGGPGRVRAVFSPRDGSQSGN